MWNIGSKLQTKYGTCEITSETQMTIIDSSNELHPNGTIIDMPPLEISISQEKVVVKTPRKPKAPAPVAVTTKTEEQEMAELESAIEARKKQLASLG